MDGKQRSDKQNRALHKYCELLADAFNSAGLDMKQVLKPEVDIPWTKESVKEFIWKPILKAMFHKDSTTKMTTKEIDEVFDVINRHISEKFGITEPFPSMNDIKKMLKKENKL